MKVYKVTCLVIDFDGIGEDGIKSNIENTRYANRCIGPDVMAIEERDVGEWDDRHPLNHRDTYQAEFNRLFPQGATP